MGDIILNRIKYDGHVSKCERFFRVIARISEESEGNE